MNLSILLHLHYAVLVVIFIAGMIIMADKIDIQLPVRFNPFKHHRNYILSILEGAASDDIISLLDTVCNNYIDIYTGMLTPEIIIKEVADTLKSNQAFHFEDFCSWIASKKGYQLVKLEDQSEWVIRKGDDIERYIHIHPTRTGTFTIRLKGSSLKTIYMLKTSFTGDDETVLVDNVNRIRRKIGLSPVKKLDKNKGILKCYESFFNCPIRNQT